MNSFTQAGVDGADDRESETWKCMNRTSETFNYEITDL